MCLSVTPTKRYTRPVSALVVFAKWPAPGHVKTRLCPPLTPGQAAELAHAFLLDTVERAMRLRDVQIWVAYAPTDARTHFANALPAGIRYLPQRGHDLGEREWHVFADLFREQVSPVLLMGSDLPTLPLGHLEAAFRLLSEAKVRVVFGPSRDGGYYCVGAKPDAAGLTPLFENIAWGTDAVLRQTLEQARRHDIEVRLAPEWDDVDTFDDVRRLRMHLASTPDAFNASRTREVLQRFDLERIA